VARGKEELPSSLILDYDGPRLGARMRLFSIWILLFACLSLFPSKQWAAVSRASKTGQAASGKEQFPSPTEGTQVQNGEIHSATATDLTPVADLAERVVPWLAKNIVLISIPKEHGLDVFELETKNGKLIVRASGAPSAAMGLNHYLKYYCHRSVSHVGNNIRPVGELPALPQPVHRTSRFTYRYLFNY